MIVLKNPHPHFVRHCEVSAGPHIQHAARHTLQLVRFIPFSQDRYFGMQDNSWFSVNNELSLHAEKVALDEERE